MHLPNRPGSRFTDAAGAKVLSHATAASPSIIAQTFTAEQAVVADRAAQRIREYQRTSTADMLEIGNLLNEVKATLPHGAFGKWLEAEVGWTQRTAQNYMRAAEAFAGKCETVSHIPPAILYRLASPSIPDAVRDDALSHIQDSARPPLTQINDIVDRAQREAQGAKKAEARARRKAKLLPRQLAREERKEARRAKEAEKRERERKEANGRASELVGSLSDEQLDLLRALVAEDLGFSLSQILRKAMGERAGNV
jgi:hypothetical protein